MRGLFSLMLRYSWMLALVTGIAFYLTGEEIVRILLATTYLPAADLLRWAAPVSFFFLTGTVFCRTLIALDRTRTVAAVTVSAAILNLVLNAILVPKLQKEGAALATVISLAFMAVYAGCAIKAWRWIDRAELKPLRLLGFFVWCGAGFYVVTQFVSQPFLVLAAAGSWSLLGILVSGCFHKDELTRAFSGKQPVEVE